MDNSKTKYRRRSKHEKATPNDIGLLFVSDSEKVSGIYDTT
jgi:hypothetical protein